jgi:hypothetical protein
MIFILNLFKSDSMIIFGGYSASPQQHEYGSANSSFARPVPPPSKLPPVSPPNIANLPNLANLANLPNLAFSRIRKHSSVSPPPQLPQLPSSSPLPHLPSSSPLPQLPHLPSFSPPPELPELTSLQLPPPPLHVPPPLPQHPEVLSPPYLPKLPSFSPLPSSSPHPLSPPTPPSPPPTSNCSSSNALYRFSFIHQKWYLITPHINAELKEGRLIEPQHRYFHSAASCLFFSYLFFS